MRTIILMGLLSIAYTGTRVTVIGEPTTKKEAIARSVDYDNHAQLLTENGIDQMLDSSYLVINQSKVTVTRFGVSQDTVAQGTGSATVIGEDDGYIYLLTCAHVLDFSHEDRFHKVVVNASRFFVRKGRNTIPTEVLFMDRKADVALLKTKWAFAEGYSGAVIKDFAVEDDVRAGDVAYSSGYPLGTSPVLTKGMVSARDKWTLLVQTPVSPGNSGGALYVLRKGEVVLAGMTQMLTPYNELYGYISIDRIRIIFKKYGYQHLL